MVTRKQIFSMKAFFDKVKISTSSYTVFLVLQPLSESELIDELSEDFDQSKRKEKQSKPAEKTKVCF